MYLRCANCQGSLWVNTGTRLPISLKTTCSRCDQEYHLKTPVSCLGMTAGQLHQTATTYARDHEVDLPAAYSVVLGVMPLEEVKEFGTETSVVCRTFEGGGERVFEGVFDPEFLPAVEAGTLSARQAQQRGEREAFARHLAMRHRLSLATAYDVADNRKSLLQAIRQRNTASVIDVRIAPPPFKGMLALVVLLILAGIALGSWRGHVAEQATQEVRAEARGVPAVPLSTDVVIRAPQDVLAASTEAETGEDGLPLRVVGPDPYSVLVRLCESRNYACLEPYKVEATVPPNPKARLGLYRSYNTPDTVLALTIHQDPGSRRWIVGDGERPIEGWPAPEAAVIAYRTR